MTSGIVDLKVIEQRFHSLFQNAPFSAALLLGDDLKIEIANEVSLALWGKDSSIIGKPLLEAMPEIAGQEVYNLVRQVYRTGHTYEGKEHNARLLKDGEMQTIYVNLVYKPVKDPEGTTMGVFVAGYDVTDLVLSRQQLQRSEMRANVAIESTGLGTFELNYKTGEFVTSHKFDQIFGFTSAVAHADYLGRIHPHDLDTRNQAHATAKTTGKLFYRARLTLPDDTLRWVQVTGSIIFDSSHAPELLIGAVLDVTEEKLALDTIQDSELRFRTLITETPQVGAGLYIGPELRIQYVNDVMLAFWGKDKSIVGKTMREALPELNNQPFFAELEAVYSTGKPYTGNEVAAVLNKDGALHTGYFNYTYKALRNSHGEIYGIHHMAVDVTAQVLSKLEVVARENEMRNLFEQTPVGIGIFKGPSLVVELVNDTLLSYWGRRREQVINKPVFESLPELVEQGIKDIALNVYQHGDPYTSPPMPLNLVRHGRDETIFVQFGFQAINNLDGTAIGLLAIANDVTDLITSRQRVEKNEMRLRFLADSMPQVVWIADAGGTVTYYNQRVKQFAGHARGDDGSWEWNGMVHPDDLEQTAIAWRNAVKHGTPYQVEHRVQMQDGRYRWHLSRAYAYQTEEGIKWFGTATDVDDQKTLEMNLDALVKERTLELQQSNDDLQQFAHVASHDLKEPVRKIKTFGLKLLHDYNSRLDERGQSFITKMIAATERMNAMINGLLNYASLTASNVMFQQVDLNQVIADIQSDLELLIHEKRARLNVGNLPVISGVSELIHQLFYNLINNSLKFSKPDVTPVIDIACHHTTTHDGAHYHITVTDNGIGFEQEYADSIFTSFIRLHSKDEYEGTGLGLALAKKVVERHGGTITATGRPQAGARFDITFPALPWKK